MTCYCDKLDPSYRCNNCCIRAKTFKWCVITKINTRDRLRDVDDDGWGDI